MVTEEGQTAAPGSQDEQNLRLAGYEKCHMQLCDFWIKPEIAQVVDQSGGLFTCPRCHQTYNLIARVGNAPTQFTPGGKTIAGITLAEQGDIAEDLVRGLGALPGYGPFVWWHEGGARAPSPLDGATAEWGVEVKAVNADAKNLRFIPGRVHEKQTKIDQAATMGLRGILGVLVLLNYRSSLADIYVMEMPLEPWTTQRGRAAQGPVAFRHHNGTHLVAEVPFDNPLTDPTKDAPVVPEPIAPSITDDIPF